MTTASSFGFLKAVGDSRLPSFSLFFVLLKTRGHHVGLLHSLSRADVHVILPSPTMKRKQQVGVFKLEKEKLSSGEPCGIAPHSVVVRFAWEKRIGFFFHSPSLFNFFFQSPFLKTYKAVPCTNMKPNPCVNLPKPLFNLPSAEAITNPSSNEW